ncbi:MAG: carboxypeptidase regulatory-like domain-containing protein [Gemmatimonadota bacterium]
MRSLIRGLGLAVLLPTMSAAQQIRGVVVDDSTGQPILGVRIELLAGHTTVRATTFSAAAGWFELFPQIGGQFLVRASHAAYRGVGTLAVALGPQEIITVVVRLSGGPIPLEPLVVKATARDGLSGYRERARRGAFGRFITRADIDKNGAYSLAHALRFAPEVSLARVFDGVFTTDGIFMRSFGGMCVPGIYLNGLAMPVDRGFDINDLINVDEIEGIEVYRNSLSVPMEFVRLSDPPGLWCGVIAVWSRPLPRAPVTLKRLGFAGLLVGVPILLGRLLR